MPEHADDVLWSATLPGPGVGGLVVADGRVVVSGRDASDASDRFDAFDLDTGAKLWTHQYRASADFDYGNSPRATPAFDSGVVVTQGASGRVTGIDLQSGIALWKIDLSQLSGGEVPTWGYSGSPLIVDQRVYVQAGGSSSIVKIDLFSGDILNQFGGPPGAYASLGTIRSDEDALVGVDADGYFVCRRSDGKRIWSHRPELGGDFGVPSPVVASGNLIFASENNGIQLFRRQRQAFPSSPSAINDLLIPDSHTPVAVGNKLFVAFEGLHCLSIDDQLRMQWSVGESLITGYASMIASTDRALVATERGELLLYDTASSGTLLDRRTLHQGKAKLFSHPAVTRDRLVIRVGDELRCYRLSSPSDSDPR